MRSHQFYKLLLFHSTDVPSRTAKSNQTLEYRRFRHNLNKLVHLREHFGWLAGIRKRRYFYYHFDDESTRINCHFVNVVQKLVLLVTYSTSSATYWHHLYDFERYEILFAHICYLVSCFHTIVLHYRSESNVDIRSTATSRLESS